MKTNIRDASYFKEISDWVVNRSELEHIMDILLEAAKRGHRYGIYSCNHQDELLQRHLKELGFVVEIQQEYDSVGEYYTWLIFFK